MIHLSPEDVVELPEGQQRALLALTGQEEAPTYEEASEIAGIHIGTLKRYLKRIRENHPATYMFAFKIRRLQLAVRHQEALERADEHSHEYHSNKYRSEMKQLAWALGNRATPW